jgi:hypothetical protein
MNNQARRIQPEDPEIAEEWLRETDEPDLRAVGACKIDRIGGWQVSVWVMEFIRSDPLESELRQRIRSALLGVSGVSSAEEEDREVWFVTGTPSGQALVEAAAKVVDELAAHARAYIASEF